MVGEGVFVPRGVGVIVSVGVDVGRALAVCVDAAFAVCSMILLIAPGSSVGTTGAAFKVGTQANIVPKARNHINSFVLRFNIRPFTLTCSTMIISSQQ